MAAAGHYMAAQAAFQVLEAGGNAIDAGVAGGIALGVLQCEYVGFAGVAPIMIHLAETGETITIAGLGWWPKAARLDYFNEHHGGKIPHGVLRTVIPAAPDAWITALERYGTMSYGQVASAALRFAKDGFPAPTLLCSIVTSVQDELRRWDSNAAIFLPNGRPPSPGDIFVQSDLARTIQYMIDQESAASGKGRAAGLAAARDAFYRGDIARTMVRFQQEQGGWLSEEDLAGYYSEVAPALKVGFGDAEVYTCGPWCQGPLLGQALTMLDGTDFSGYRHNDPAYIHLLTETLKLAYADRHRYYGDPRFVDVPIETLLSAEYAATRRREINPAQAFPAMPPPGNAAPGQAAQAKVRPFEPADRGSQIDTSYICVVDDKGNAFSATPSDGASAAPVIPGLGFVPSTRGSQSWTDPTVPAVMAPGKRPRLTPSPSMARKPGEWLMPFGSPGNDVQPQAMLQVLLNMLVWNMPPQDAIDQPRFATFSYPRSSAPHPYDPGLLRVESRIAPDTRDALRDLGHVMKDWPDWDYAAGAVCAIMANRRTGTMEGGSDPRRPTAVIGW
jgi:gamma-glutamyltranspeptidase/glutathione hydrolase